MACLLKGTPAEKREDIWKYLKHSRFEFDRLVGELNRKRCEFLFL